METLADLLAPASVPVATLHERYGALLELVRRLIGVVPNCDQLLEIWPPAFRTYNVMVPNFLNLPFFMWGFGAPRSPVGLALYVASRTAGCAYCAAHTCSFALRRGATPAAVAGALDADSADQSPAERAAIAVARALATVPTPDVAPARAALLAAVSPADAEWIVLGVAMMGFLNKWMDAIGVELETPTLAEVQGLIGPKGWSPGQHARGSAVASGPIPRADSLAAKLGIIRFAPSAMSLDRRWTHGVPDRWLAAGAYLREHTGHDFPVLSRLTHRRAIRALATMLRENLDRESTVLGLPTKLACGLIYCDAVGNSALADELRAAGAQASSDNPAALAVARAIAPSPAVVDAQVVASARTLPAAAIVEIVTFLAVLQAVHRLEAFYPARS